MADDLKVRVSAQDDASAVLRALGLNVGGLGQAFKAMGINLPAIGANLALVTVGAVAVGAAFKVATDMVNDFNVTAQEIGRMSQITGISTETLSKFRYIADLTGGNLNDVTAAIKNMANTLQSARTGTGAAAEAFRELRLNISQLMAMSPEDQFMTIAQAISTVEDPTMRAALAVDIFGRSGTELLPMLDDLNGKLAKAAEHAPLFTNEDIKAAEDFDEAVLNLKSAWEKFGIAVAPIIDNVLVPLVNLLTDLASMTTTDPFAKWQEEYDKTYGNPFKIPATYVPWVPEPSPTVAPLSYEYAGEGVINVIINVEGSVTAERDLAETIREQLINIQNSNGTIGLR